MERWNRGAYDWLAVTSANGASAFADAGARPGAGRIAAVGPATAEALRSRGFEVELAPEHDFSGASLGRVMRAELSEGEPRRILLPLSEIADTVLETALRDAGHAPDRVTAYRTLPAPRDPDIEAEVAAGRFDAILVMSGSTAREVARRFAPVPSRTALAAIGRPTASALAEHGLRADVVAEEHTASGLLAALADAAHRFAPARIPDLIDDLDPADTEGTTA